MMPIHAWWKRIVTTWQKFRPARRRRTLGGCSAESFEPRRLLSAFVVNSLADSHDAIPGDGIAADAYGQITLRAALEEANAHAGADTIRLPAGVIGVMAANGPLVVTDDVTIIGNGAAIIDGTVFDEVFSTGGTGLLQLDHVTVRSAKDVAIPRPVLLTANTRQADLIVAFSAIAAEPITAESKTSNGLSSLIGITNSESLFDEPPSAPDRKLVKPATLPDDIVVPTPEQAIDQIINALFCNEPDFVLPVSLEQTPKSMPEDNARPIQNRDADESPLDDEQSLNDCDDEQGFRTVLRGWADEAGWNEFDFLSRSSKSAVMRPQHGHRVAAMAGMLLGSITATSWSRADPRLWRESLSLSAWRSRLERLRRRPR
jgi:hypothetical protein